MKGMAIVKIEVQNPKMDEGIVAQFNEFIHRNDSGISFVSSREGYFQLSFDEQAMSSVGVVPFCSFLESTGYTIEKIQGINEGDHVGANIEFRNASGEKTAVSVSTLRIY